jgi:vanillate O-demethylase ferredoxin subunit
MTDELIQMRVTSTTLVAEDIRSIKLTPVSTTPLPFFEAGAHIDVHLPGCIRQYSLCNDPHEAEYYELGVLREPISRGGSEAIHKLLEGDELKISKPRNLFALVDDRASPSLLLAGGIGITPLLSMAHVLSRGKQDFSLHYCTRSEERTAFHKHLKSSPFAEKVNFHRDDLPETKLDAAAVLLAQTPGTHLYACGPSGFLDYVLSSARKVGWPESHIHFERFSAPITTNDECGAFEVTVSSTGEVFVVPPNVPISQILVEAGYHIPLSCEQGVCGTCLTRVIDGKLVHRDSFLTEAEQACGDQMLLCCSRAVTGSRLTLEL